MPRITEIRKQRAAKKHSIAPPPPPHQPPPRQQSHHHRGHPHQQPHHHRRHPPAPRKKSVKFRPTFRKDPLQMTQNLEDQLIAPSPYNSIELFDYLNKPSTASSSRKRVDPLLKIDPRTRKNSVKPKIILSTFSINLRKKHPTPTTQRTHYTENQIESSNFPGPLEVLGSDPKLYLGENPHGVGLPKEISWDHHISLPLPNPPTPEGVLEFIGDMIHVKKNASSDSLFPLNPKFLAHDEEDQRRKNSSNENIGIHPNMIPLNDTLLPPLPLPPIQPLVLQVPQAPQEPVIHENEIIHSTPIIFYNRHTDKSILPSPPQNSEKLNNNQNSEKVNDTLVPPPPPQPPLVPQEPVIHENEIIHSTPIIFYNQHSDKSILPSPQNSENLNDTLLPPPSPEILENDKSRKNNNIIHSTPNISLEIVPHQQEEPKNQVEFLAPSLLSRKDFLPTHSTPIILIPKKTSTTTTTTQLPKNKKQKVQKSKIQKFNSNEIIDEKHPHKGSIFPLNPGIFSRSNSNDNLEGISKNIVEISGSNSAPELDEKYSIKKGSLHPKQLSI